MLHLRLKNQVWGLTRGDPPPPPKKMLYVYVLGGVAQSLPGLICTKWEIPGNPWELQQIPCPPPAPQHPHHPSPATATLRHRPRAGGSLSSEQQLACHGPGLQKELIRGFPGCKPRGGACVTHVPGTSVLGRGEGGRGQQRCRDSAVSFADHPPPGGTGDLPPKPQGQMLCGRTWGSPAPAPASTPLPQGCGDPVMSLGCSLLFGGGMLLS